MGFADYVKSQSRREGASLHTSPEPSKAAIPTVTPDDVKKGYRVILRGVTPHLVDSILTRYPETTAVMDDDLNPGDKMFVQSLVPGQYKVAPTTLCASCGLSTPEFHESVDDWICPSCRFSSELSRQLTSEEMSAYIARGTSFVDQHGERVKLPLFCMNAASPEDYTIEQLSEIDRSPWYEDREGDLYIALERVWLNLPQPSEFDVDIFRLELKRIDDEKKRYSNDEGFYVDE